MKKCPFCAESIQDEAIKCRFCGEFLNERELSNTRPDSSGPVSEKPDQQQPEQQEQVEIQSGAIRPVEGRPPRPGNPNLGRIGIGITVLILLGLVSGSSSSTAAWVALAFSFLGFLLGLYLVSKTPRKRLGVMALALFGFCSLIAGHEIGSRIEKEAAEQVRKKEESDAAEARRIEQEQRLEALRANKDQNYKAGADFLKRGEYTSALEAFEKVSEVDSEYQDLSSLVKKAKAGQAKQLEQERKAEGSRLYAMAVKRKKSDNCGELASAERDLGRAVQLNPALNVASVLKEVQEERLRCYAGNDQIQMAIQIKRRNPVTLYVWIKNQSPTTRHANPNHFTLVTKGGGSFPYSTNTFEYSKSFPAVDLQPGTEASGMLVFDTNEAPRTLVYQELLGSRVSRDFP